jgi:signal peptidase II
LIKLLDKSEFGSRSERRILFFAIAVCAVLVIIDQVTKHLVIHYISYGKIIPIISGFFNLTYITNRGAAWGILEGQRWLLLGFGFAVLIAALFAMRWFTEGWNERYLAMFMVISGIIGNSIDRIWRQEVVDFLDFRIFAYRWPSFNVADSAICVGIAIYILSLLLRPEKKNEEKDKDSEAAEAAK